MCPRNRTGDPLVRRLVLNPLSHTSQGSFWLFSRSHLHPQYETVSSFGFLECPALVLWEQWVRREKISKFVKGEGAGSIYLQG